MRTRTALALLLLAPLLLVAPRLWPGQAVWPMATTLLEPWASELPAEERAQLAERAVGSQLDKLVQHHYYNRSVREGLAHGEFPWWQSNSHGGLPLLGSALPGVLYPLHWPFFLLADEYAWYAWHLALHLLIAGAGLFALLRRLGTSNPAALLGGICFAFSGWMAARTHFPMLISAAAWAPWMLWAVEALVRERRWRDVAALALATGLSWLGGMPGVTLVALQLAAFLGAVRLALAWRKSGAKSSAQRGAFAALGVVLGLAIAAPQLVSGAIYAERFAREQVSPESWAELSLEAPQLETLMRPTAFAEVRGNVPRAHDPVPEPRHLHRLASLSLPDARGARAADGTFLPGTLTRGSFADNLAEMTIYLGVLPLLLGASLLFLGTSGCGWIYLGLAALALAIGYGQPQLLQAIRLLPGADIGPPVRFLFGYVLAASVFAGLQLERWLRAPAARTRAMATGALLVSAAALLACHALSTRDPESFGRELYRGALLEHASALLEPEAALAFVEGIRADEFALAAERFVAGWKRAALLALLSAAALLCAAGAKRSLLLAAPAFLVACDTGLFFFEWLPPSPANERVADHPVLHALRSYHERAHADGDRPHIVRIGSFPGTSAYGDLLFPTNLPSTVGFDDAQGYFVATKGWEELLQRLPESDRRYGTGVWAPRTLQALAHSLLDVLGTRYAFVPQSLGPAEDDALRAAGWKRLDGAVDPAFERRDFSVLENTQVFPRAWFVDRAIVARDAEALEQLSSPRFDAARAAVIEAPIEGLTTARAQELETDTRSTPRPARLVYRSLNRVEFELELGANESGLLVIGEGWAADWHATVDGEERAVHRVNHDLRGVLVSGAGVHRVKLKYVEELPKLLIAPAAGIALLCAVLFLGGTFAAARARRGAGT
ncbi:MAG: hypothetical protein IPN34_04520 [Planctomycetes bacterium]|nr:hypothetical protein [Planctomycetota bacterium]